MPVPVTEEERRSPLFKYFEREIAPAPPEIVEKIMAGDFAPDGGLHPTRINDLFEDGYLKGEFGIWELEDGGVMVANLTPMPGVTPEMFDWWFAWHGLNSLRYKIWDRDEHYYVQTQNVAQALDASLSLKERYWNTTHDIKESLLPDQPPVNIHLTFVPPETIGFDPEKLRTFGGTMICTAGPTIMCHFIRPTADGCELRTRFWMGYAVKNGKIEKLPGFPGRAAMGKALLIHNVKEFANLAKILPEVYAEFRDDFRVAPFHDPREA